MKQTTNYQLPQWEETDRIMMKDFNDAFAKIEDALPKIGVLEDYDGSADVTVDLGRQPRMVVIGSRYGFSNAFSTSSSGLASGHSVALRGYPGYKSNFPSETTMTIAVEITESGFTVHEGLKEAWKPYFYLALF